jgi:hypothetical protein
VERFESYGTIIFDPDNKTKKHDRQSSWKKVALVELDSDIPLKNNEVYSDLSDYYAWFIKRRFNLKLNKPLRGSHITIINDRIGDHNSSLESYEQTKELFNNKRIDFSYNVTPRTDGKHWWLRVFIPQAEAIRTVAGFKEIPYFGFHLTLGEATHLNLEHSEYILRQCLKHNL